MIKRNKTYNKVVKRYLKELKSALICSYSMKHVLLSTVKLRISELVSDSSTLSFEDLCNEIGTPEEIAHSLECRSDYGLLKIQCAFIELLNWLLAPLGSALPQNGRLFSRH